MSDPKLFAFVLMPFDKAFEDVYRLGIQAAADECGVFAQRVDDQMYTESMLQRICDQIRACDFIIADVSGRNPNVMYEVGYAHAKDKLCTLTTNNVADIPFDLKHHRHIVYSSIGDLKTKLTSDISWLKAEVIRKRGAQFEVSVKFRSPWLEKTTYRAVGKFDLVIDITGKMIEPGTEIEAVYLHTGKNLQLRQGGDLCAASTSDIPDYSARHLLRTNQARISPGTWTQVSAQGTRELAFDVTAKGEFKDKYNVVGNVVLEIRTSKFTFRETTSINVDFEEFPF